MRLATCFACTWIAVGATVGVVSAGESTDAVREAIVVAVQQRFGAAAHAQVLVSDLRTDAADAPADVTALPDPGARTGRPVQFTLRSGSRRLGTAVARITVSAAHVRAAAPLARDASISADDVQAVDGDVADVRFEPLPQLDEVVGAQVRRVVVAGEVLSHAVVVVPDAVKAGDEVKVVARVGRLEAWGTGRASGSGRVGDVVRITRGSAPGLQRARVLSPGVVQVLLEQTQEIR